MERNENEFKEELDQLIKGGRTNRLLLAYLRESRGLKVSNSWLKKFLKKHGLKRHDVTVSDGQIDTAVGYELTGPGINAGYRTMHEVIRLRHGLRVSRGRVSRILSRLRPRDFCNVRSFPWERRLVYCPGPNFVWSMDGYDKLGRWGIYIDGCVDQFSRRVMWLTAHSTNRRPEFVGELYLETVEQIGVCPENVYSDHGNENVRVSQFQTWFFTDAEDSRPASHHTWTFSIYNVTVESWWRQMRARCAQYWMDHFRQLEMKHLWNGDVVDRWALLAIYLPVVNWDLKRTMLDHNNHRIRTQRDRVRPGGRPEDLYALPREFGGRHCGLPVLNGDITRLRTDIDCNAQDTPDAVPADVMEEIQVWLIGNGIVVDRENVKHVYMQVRRLLGRIVGVIPDLNSGLC